MKKYVAILIIFVSAHSMALVKELNCESSHHDLSFEVRLLPMVSTAPEYSMVLYKADKVVKELIGVLIVNTKTRFIVKGITKDNRRAYAGFVKGEFAYDFGIWQETPVKQGDDLYKRYFYSCE